MASARVQPSLPRRHCDLGLDLQGSWKTLEKCLLNASRKPSQCTHLPRGSLMPAPPFGAAPPLGRHSAELQVLVRGDVVLELVGFKEVAQLMDVVLVQLVHLLPRGLHYLLHLDGLPHCKTEMGSGPGQGPLGRAPTAVLVLAGKHPCCPPLQPDFSDEF